MSCTTGYILCLTCIGDIDMGKGDKRTKKGKIYRGTYGKRRPRKLAKKKAAPAKRA